MGAVRGFLGGPAGIWPRAHAVRWPPSSARAVLVTSSPLTNVCECKSNHTAQRVGSRPDLIARARAVACKQRGAFPCGALERPSLPFQTATEEWIARFSAGSRLHCVVPPGLQRASDHPKTLGRGRHTVKHDLMTTWSSLSVLPLFNVPGPSQGEPTPESDRECHRDPCAPGSGTTRNQPSGTSAPA